MFKQPAGAAATVVVEGGRNTEGNGKTGVSEENKAGGAKEAERNG